jgi:hypothetical protein
MAGDLQNVASSFLGANDMRGLNLSSNDPKFKQLERYLNNVRILIPSSNVHQTEQGQKQRTRRKVHVLEE